MESWEVRHELLDFHDVGCRRLGDGLVQPHRIRSRRNPVASDEWRVVSVLFRLSAAGEAVLWLWQNDDGNWFVGSHAVVHEPTGVAIWTSNSVYGLSIYYDIPVEDRKNAHPCNGRRVKLKWLDRR